MTFEYEAKKAVYESISQNNLTLSRWYKFFLYLGGAILIIRFYFYLQYPLVSIYQSYYLIKRVMISSIFRIVIGGGMKPILDSGGKIAGEIFCDIKSPNVLTPGYYLQYQLMSGVATRNNDYKVNSFGKYLNYTNNSIGQTLLKIKEENRHGVKQYLFFSSYKNSPSWPLIDETLWTSAFFVASAVTDGAASALFAAGGALNPFLFLGSNTENTPPQMNFTYTQNAGVGVMGVFLMGVGLTITIMH